MAAHLRAFLTEMGIDDPDETLARYLPDPNAVGRELEAESLERLLALGASAAKAGDVSKAQATLSRALAIDEGNERALKLLGSLGRRRRLTTIGVLVASALVLAMLGLGYLSWRSNVTGLPADEPVLKTEQRPSDASGGAPDRNAPELSPVSETEPVVADDETKPEPKVNDASANGRRWVVFKPTPPNVSISVNGSPLKPYGPDFQRVRLKVGNHMFRFVGAEGCCEDRVIRKKIPPGARDFELPVKLRYKPARLYLKGPAPADASVRITLSGNRTVSGRIREILRIRMSSLQASAQVQIRAPGYRTYRTVVKLRAGADLTEHSFKLEREGETP